MATSTTKTKTQADRKTFVTLRFAGDELDPQEISAILPVKPTRAHKKGEGFSAGSEAGSLRGRTGIWFLATDKLVDSEDLTEHLRFVQNLLQPEPRDSRISSLREVLDRTRSRAHVTCFWRGDPEEPSPQISSAFRSVIRQLPGDIETDFYSLHELNPEVPMNIERDRVDSLVQAPTEALNVELKRWLSPDDLEGASKIVRGVLALRNRNGGFFLIGFDNKTLMPENIDRPTDVRQAFHPDKIQSLISRYASEPFEVAVAFGVRDGLEYPIVCVPEGVRFPVAAKRDLRGEGGKFLIREGDVYFRTLDTNGTPSTAKVRPRDWQDIIEICFENREADIGRFLRRHLSGSGNDRLLQALGALGPSQPPTLKERANALLDEGEKRMKTAIAARTLPSEKTAVLERGAWSTALVIDPPQDGAIPGRAFLNAFAAANPNYTGWPIWLDSRGFDDKSMRPTVVEHAWQSLIISLGETWSEHVDFIRLDPKGEFYFWRLLQDDLTTKIKPGEGLDVILVIIRVAEAIAVGLSAAKALGWHPDSTLNFGFRWTGLCGRELVSWANPMASILPGHRAEDSAVETHIELALDTPESAIPPFVQQATRDLFVAFSGYTVPEAAVEHWVKRLLERRL